MQRNIYLSLLHLEPEDGNEKASPIPASVIRTALLRRAVEDIHRIIQIRAAKQACSTLLQRGSVGDDLWQRFLRAEKEMEEELRDVVMEVSDEKQYTGSSLILTFRRQMLLRPTGVKQFSNPQMRSLPTPCSGNGSKRYNRRPLLRRNGGRNAEQAFKPSS